MDQLIYLAPMVKGVVWAKMIGSSLFFGLLTLLASMFASADTEVIEAVNTSISVAGAEGPIAG